MCDVAKSKALFWAAVTATFFLLAAGSSEAASLTGSLTVIPQGSAINLSLEGPLDWIHWGHYTEFSSERKAGVSPLISEFTTVASGNGYTFAYRYTDNYNGYTWTDGTSTVSVTNTTAGVWAYG